MAKVQRNELPDFGRGLQAMRRLGRDFPKVAGVTAVNFFKDRFQRQGWQDSAFERWPARKGRGTLPPLGGEPEGGTPSQGHFTQKIKPSRQAHRLLGFPLAISLSKAYDANIRRR